jgi:hypothetical protein
MLPRTLPARLMPRAARQAAVLAARAMAGALKGLRLSWPASRGPLQVVVTALTPSPQKWTALPPEAVRGHAAGEGVR